MTAISEKQGDIWLTFSEVETQINRALNTQAAKFGQVVSYCCLSLTSVSGKEKRSI